MNELIRSQRKAIQSQIDKRKNEPSWFEKIRLSITIFDMQVELNEMLKTKRIEL